MPKMNEISESQQTIDTDANGNLQYRDASESGFVEIMVPSPPGSPRDTETLHARNLGQHIISKVESSMREQGYLKTSALQTPAAVFRHYMAVAKGSELLDSATQERMEEIARGFSKEPATEEYFQTVVKPWLGSLTAKRR